MSDRPGDEFLLKMSSSIIRSADGMNCLIEDLLGAAKIESSLFGVEPGPYPMPSLVREAIDQFGGLAREKRIERRLWGWKY